MQTLVIALWERVDKLGQVVEEDQAAQIAALETELARRSGRGKEGRRRRRRSARTGHVASGRSPGAACCRWPRWTGWCPSSRGPVASAVRRSAARTPIRSAARWSRCRRYGPVTEYQRHTLRCPHCQTLTKVDWPAGVPRSAFGPTVQAWVGLLSGAYRLSKRNIADLLSDAFRVEVALGSVSQLEQQVSMAVAAAQAYVRQQPTVNLDETGWRQRGAKAWQWTATTALATVSAIRRRRGAQSRPRVSWPTPNGCSQGGIGSAMVRSVGPVSGFHNHPDEKYRQEARIQKIDSFPLSKGPVRRPPSYSAPSLGRSATR